MPINPGAVPVTAAGFAGFADAGVPERTGRGCGHAAPASGGRADGWVFVLPDGSGGLIRLDLTFTKQDGSTATVSVPSDGGGVVTVDNASKAWVTTPMGWTLVAGHALVTGSSDAGTFDLAHACPGSAAPPRQVRRHNTVEYRVFA